MSLPCGFTAGGLPIGLQLQGNYFDEARILDVAHRYQQATDWHVRTPPSPASLTLGSLSPRARMGLG